MWEFMPLGIFSTLELCNNHTVKKEKKKAAPNIHHAPSPPHSAMIQFKHYWALAAEPQ